MDAQVERTPDAVAVVHGEFEITYAELRYGAQRVGAQLARLGAGRDVPVGICLERSIQMPVALLGCLEAGAACLPLDPSYPQQRLRQMLADAAPPIVIATARTAELLPAPDGRLLLMETCADAGSSGVEPGAPPRGRRADDLAYVIYTSGSTGEPKGVMLTSRGLAHHAMAVADLYALGPADRVLQFASIGFDVSIEEIFPTLASGGAVVLRDDDVPILGASWLDWLDAARPSVLNLPTAHWHEWVRDLRAVGRAVPECVRLVVVGGERALSSAYAAWRGVGGDRVRWINAYGPAEATVTATAFEAPRNGAWPATVDPPIGRPVGGATVHVLDERGKPVARGRSGELHIGGPGLARGYLGRAELTAERFVTSPAVAGERLYRTGDLVRELEDGNLAFIGRQDDQVKIRGVRVELGEVERVIARHPHVADVAVVASEDAPGDRHLLAYVVAKRAAGPLVNGSLTPSDLRRFLASRLPRQMIPAGFSFVDAMPVTPSGKIDKSALPRHGAARQAAAPAVRPRTETEAAVARAWSDVLDVDDIGVDDDFFDLGGQSLQATQIIAALRGALGVDIGLRSLFSAPTVAGLAAGIDALQKRRLRAPLEVRPHPPGERIPLSLSQEHMWRLEATANPPGLYNVTAMHTFAEPVDVGALRAALAHVVCRHSGLRTQFRVEEGVPHQMIVTDVALDLEVLDLVDVAADERDDRFGRLLAEQDAAAFNVAQAPLFRPCLYRLAQDRAVLATTLDHLICDGTSAYIFLAEVVAAYAASSRGEEPVLPNLEMQYSDFALWQHESLNEELIAGQVEYWKRALAGVRLGPAVPFDHIPGTPTRRICARAVSVEPDLYSAIRDLAQQSGVTVFVIVAATFQALCARASQQTDVVVSTTLSGRQRAEVARLIGCFHSVGRIRTDLSGDPSFVDVIQRTGDAVVGLLDNSDVPFFRVRDAALPPMPSGGVVALLAAVPTEFQYFPTARDEWTPGAGVVERPGADRGPDQLYFRGHMHPLVVTLLDDGAQMWGTFSYKTDWYEAATIDALADAFLRVLTVVVAQPLVRLSQLVMPSIALRRE